MDMTLLLAAVLAGLILGFIIASFFRRVLIACCIAAIFALVAWLAFM